MSSGLRAPLPIGKLPPALLADLLADLPAPPADVLLGPRLGEDACAIDVPSGVLVAATDPITFTAQEVGRFSVIVNANDVAVMGVRPRWFLAVVLLPPGSTEVMVRDIIGNIREGLRHIGATLVGGHTEVTATVTQPIVVGQFIGIADDRRFITSGGMRSGDVLIQVGHAPVEGAAVLAREADDRLIGLDPTVLGEAQAALDRPGISVVEAALLAAELGATAMHDPTEGGLAAGIHELAEASGVGVRVDLSSLLWFGPGRAVCEALAVDPMATLASGTLLAAFRPDRARAALRALAGHGHAASDIGRASERSGVWDAGGRPLVWPERDEVARLLSASDAEG